MNFIKNTMDFQKDQFSLNSFTNSHTMYDPTLNPYVYFIYIISHWTH